MADPVPSVSIGTGLNVVTASAPVLIAAENDLFCARGQAIPIASRDSPTQITLKQPWPVASLAGEQAFSILSLGEYWRSAISINKRFADLLAKWEVVNPFKFDAAGTLAERDGYNNQPRGFVYVSVDPLPVRIFIKIANTNSASDWSAAIYIGSGGQVEFQEALDQERQQRIQADAALGQRIDTLAVGADPNVRTDLNAEIARSTGKDSQHDVQIASLRSDLTAESSARTAADTALGGRVDMEASARTSADIALGGRVDTEINARLAADANLGARIDNEASTRSGADTALGGRIDAANAATEFVRTHLVPDPVDGLTFRSADTGDPLARFSSYGLQLSGRIQIGDSLQVAATDRDAVTVRDGLGFALFVADITGTRSPAYEIPGSMSLRPLGTGGFGLFDRTGFSFLYADERGVRAPAYEIPGGVRLAPLGTGGLALLDRTGFAAFYADARGTHTPSLNLPGLRLAPGPAGGPADAIYIVDRVGFVQSRLLTTADTVVPPDFSRAEIMEIDARAVRNSALAHNRSNIATAEIGAGHTQIMVHGQSLAQGSETWPVDPPVTQDGIDMVGGSVRPQGQSGSNGAPVGSPVLQPAISTVQAGDGTVLTPSQQAALVPGDTASGEEVGINAARFARKLYLDYLGVTSLAGRKFVVGNAAVGGKTIEQLSKGNAENLYKRVLDLATAAKNAVIAAGSSYSVGALLWLQGEWNQRADTGGVTDYASYSAKLAQLGADFNADVSVGIAGQSAPAAVIMYQTGGEWTNDVYDLAVAQAQLDLCRDGGLPGYYMAAPAAPYPNKPSGHLTRNGEKWLGMMFGKVLFWTVILRRNWRPLHITGAQYRGKTILVSFHVPVPPIKFRPMYVGEKATNLLTKGFTVVDARGVVPLTSVEIAEKTAQATIAITTGRALSGTAYLYYGRQREGFGGGNVWDSDDTKSMLSYTYRAGSGDYPSANISELVDKPFPLNNPCVASKTLITAI